MQYAVQKCKRAENKWTDVGEQQSMFKIVRLFVKFSRLRKISNSWSIVFFGLRKFLNYFGLRNFSDLFGLRKFLIAFYLIQTFHPRQKKCKAFELASFSLYIPTCFHFIHIHIRLFISFSLWWITKKIQTGLNVCILQVH